MRGWLLGLLCVPALSLACWNEVRLSTSQEAKGLAKVESVLQAGDAVAAIKAMRALYGKQAIMHPYRISTDRALGDKARALLAISMIRAGHIDPKTGRGAKKSRRSQLRLLATDSLSRLRQKDDAPLLTAWHAEALATNTKTAATAKSLLEGLAQTDLLAEPEGWRTLAQLRHQAGEAALSTAALKRCIALADATRCPLTPAGGS